MSMVRVIETAGFNITHNNYYQVFDVCVRSEKVKICDDYNNIVWIPGHCYVIE